MIKVVAPQMAQRVIDRAIQVVCTCKLHCFPGFVGWGEREDGGSVGERWREEGSMYIHPLPFSPLSQAHGAMGLSSDRPLAQFFAWARILRLADGPDEVHTTAIGRMELRGK